MKDKTDGPLLPRRRSEATTSAGCLEKRKSNEYVSRVRKGKGKGTRDEMRVPFHDLSRRNMHIRGHYDGIA